MVDIIWTDDRVNFPQYGGPAYYVYNGLDCCITREVADQIKPQLDFETSQVYNFELALQAPVLEMNGRGFLIDRTHRDLALQRLRQEEKTLLAIINLYSQAVCDQDLNPDSPKQLEHFFYRVMRIPEIKVNVGRGVWRVSTNREALEKMEVYFAALPIVKALLAYRDVVKQIQTLSTGIDRDGRLRTSYNIAGTETGRWSSSQNAFGTGGNLQNVTGKLRRMFVADKGYKLAYLDLEQAESRAVALLAYLLTGKDNYLRACESGDLHTVVAKLCWPKLPWPHDNGKLDKELAETPFYRMFTYRDLAKRGGHGTNYYGQAATIAKNLRIEKVIAEQFQAAYFKGFPEIDEWHKGTAHTLQTTGCLTTPFNRRRFFFDRLTEDSTLRKAIAYVPQSMIADMLNEALFQIWHKMSPLGVQMLVQVHDAVVVQYPENCEDELLPQILKIMRKELVFNGRPFSIGSEAQVGWNWAKQVTQADRDAAIAKGKKPDELNLDGLAKYKGTDKRRRTEQPNSIQGYLAAMKPSPSPAVGIAN